MPPDNQPGGLTLSDRLTRIEQGQKDLSDLLHHIELSGSQKAQDAMAEAMKLEVRVEALERNSITADAVNTSMENARKESQATRRWVIGTAITVVVVAVTVVFNLLSIHKISFG